MLEIQYKTIINQLRDGVRVLDIKLIFHNDKIYTYNYDIIININIKEEFENIKNFIIENKNEIIILIFRDIKYNSNDDNEVITSSTNDGDKVDNDEEDNDDISYSVSIGNNNR